MSDRPTLDDLWDLDYVAYSAKRADEQAERQLEPYAGRTLQWAGQGTLLFEIQCREWACRHRNQDFLREPDFCPHVPAAFRDGDDFLYRTYSIRTPSGEPLTIKVLGTFGAEAYEMWDGDVAYPRWDVEILNPEVMFIKDDSADLPDDAFGLTVPSGLLRQVELEVPGIGTADGFTHRACNLIWPLETSAAGEEDSP